MKSKNKLLTLSFFFALFFIVSSSGSFCSDKAEETMTVSKYIPQCLYSVELKGDEIEIMEKAYQSLSENLVGLKLMDILKKKLEGTPPVVIKQTNSGHAFMPPRENSEGRPFYIEIDFEKIKNNNLLSRTGCIGEKVEQLDEFEVFEIGGADAPFYITFAHELIHLKHFLDDEKQYRQYQNEYSDNLWPIFGEDQRAQIIWKNLEEQRTVIGPDKDNISELTLRLAANYVPRYAYQDNTEWFYEDKNVILEIINSTNQEVRLSSLLRLNWQFDKETAIVSKHNSRLLKDKYKELYEAKRLKDREAEVAANAQFQLLFESDEMRARREAIAKRFEDAKSRRTLRKK